MTTTQAAPPVSGAHGTRAYRLDSIDTLRGLVIVIMALDHVRDFFMAGAAQDPMGDPSIGAALFFTRWITHFCAPVFVCLAGVSAGLMTARRSPSALGGFLFRRGLWLIAVEMFVVATATTFSPFGLERVGGLVLVPMQVIWAIGASMIVLSAAQFLGARACLVLGAIILVGHNLLDPIWPASHDPIAIGMPAWVALHAQMGIVVGPFFLAFIYPVLPWIGVMLLGFGLAQVWREAPDVRDAMLRRGGLAAIVAFLILRGLSFYGEPNPWQVQDGAVRTVLDFLNTTKYPPSLLYLLMTLGPAAVLCGYADRLPASIRQFLTTYGRVPFAFYVAHVYVIHVLAMALGVAQGFSPGQFVTLMFFFPQGYGVNLAAVYAVWLLVVAILYPWCRWVGGVKARRRDWWLSYL